MFLYTYLLINNFKISQKGIIITERPKQIKNCFAVKILNPNTNPTGVNTKNIITKIINTVEIFINLFDVNRCFSEAKTGPVTFKLYE